MAEPITTFLLTSLTLLTKKAVGSLFEKDSIVGDAAKDASVDTVKSVFNHFKDKFQANVYYTPDNYELLRSVRMAYLNSALFLCFSRLKSLDVGKWDAMITQYLPQSDGASILLKKLREQFLPTDETERKEADWIFSACEKLEDGKTTIKAWKPTEDFQIAVKQIELVLIPEEENAEPLLKLKGFLNGKLISELAETAYFQSWGEVSPKTLNNPSSPEATSIFERQTPVVQTTVEMNTSQGNLDLTTTQKINNQHKSCLPPKLLGWIENGWEEIQPSQSAVSPLGLSGKSKSFEWFDIMCAFFALEIRQNQKIANIFQTKLLLDLKYRNSENQICDLTVDIFRDELAKSNEIITMRLASLETGIKNLSEGQNELKNKLEMLLPMVASVADISQTLKTVSQDVKILLQNTTAMSQDVKQVAQKVNELPAYIKENSGRTIDAMETIRGEMREGFSGIRELVQPSGNRRVIDIEDLKMKLRKILQDANTKFSKIAESLLDGLVLAQKIPAEEVASATEKEKFLYFLGLVSLLTSRIDDAIDYHTKALALNEAVIPAHKKIIHYFNLGNAYLENDDYQKAAEYYGKSFQILDEISKKDS